MSRRLQVREFWYASFLPFVVAADVRFRASQRFISLGANILLALVPTFGVQA
jgi:Tfp pilus assembly protein PilZ